MALVLDASVAVGWALEDQKAAVLDAIFQSVVLDRALVPVIWSLEVATVLSRAVRTGRTTDQDVARFFRVIQTVAIEIETETPSPQELFALSRRYALTAYDAAYLELAMRTGLPLATFDVELARAAERAGVAVVSGV